MATAIEHAREILYNHGKPMDYKELAKKILAAGWVTGGNTVEKTVWSSLSRSKDFIKTSKQGHFTLSRDCRVKMKKERRELEE